MGIGRRDWQIPASGLKTRRPSPYLTPMLHCNLPLNSGLAGRRPVARSAGRCMQNQLLIESRLSNIYRRESFRRHSYVSLAANGVIFSSGPHGDLLALGAGAARLYDAG
jgi:Dehydroquinase class II